MLNKGNTNYTVYASILNLIHKCDEESPWPDSRNWIDWGFIYYSKGNFSVSFCCKFHRLENGISWKYIIVLYLQVLNHKILSFSKSQPGVLTYSSAWYSYKHLYKVYCYRKKRVILIRGQCQTLISQIFSGAEAIERNLPAFCLNVFQLSPSVPLLHMLLLCYWPLQKIP